MPIRRELRPLYPAHWRELSRRVRFERAAGACEGCGRPHGLTIRCLPDGRWFDPGRGTWRDRRGRPARWPDLEEMTRQYTTRAVLAAAHLDNDPATTGCAISAASVSDAISCMTAPGIRCSAGSPTGCAMPAATCSSVPIGMAGAPPWS